MQKRPNCRDLGGLDQPSRKTNQDYLLDWLMSWMSSKIEKSQSRCVVSLHCFECEQKIGWSLDWFRRSVAVLVVMPFAAECTSFFARHRRTIPTMPKEGVIDCALGRGSSPLCASEIRRSWFEFVTESGLFDDDALCRRSRAFPSFPACSLET